MPLRVPQRRIAFKHDADFERADAGMQERVVLLDQSALRDQAELDLVGMLSRVGFPVFHLQNWHAPARV